MGDDGDALLENPARITLVIDGESGTVELEDERRESGTLVERSFLDVALHAQTARLVAAVAHTDLVDVAVVVDRGAEELGDDDAATDERRGEHEQRKDPAPLASGADGGTRSEIGRRVGRLVHSHGLSRSGMVRDSDRARRTVTTAKSAIDPRVST